MIVRNVTIMSVSIRGFTAMCEPLAPEVVAAVLEAYYAEAAAAVNDTAGMLVESAGDRIVAMWNAHGDQAHHGALAINAGIRLLSRGEVINRELRSRALPPIRYGVGVDSGDAFMGEMGVARARHFTVVGDTVNRAELLSEVAGGGEMLIGDNAHSVVEGEIEVEP